MDREELAAWLHNNYEEIAPNVGWETQDGTSVPFDELPQDNQDVMLMLADRLLCTFSMQELVESPGERQQ